MAQVGGGNDYVEIPLVNNGLVVSENGFLELQGGVLGGTIAGQVVEAHLAVAPARRGLLQAAL